jgi:hypothetical protein
MQQKIPVGWLGTVEPFTVVCFMGWTGTESTITEAYCTGAGWWLTINVEQSVECLAGETEVLGENLSAALSTTNLTWPLSGRRGGNPAAIHLSYGAAFCWCYHTLRSVVKDIVIVLK